MTMIIILMFMLVFLGFVIGYILGYFKGINFSKTKIRKYVNDVLSELSKE